MTAQKFINTIMIHLGYYHSKLSHFLKMYIFYCDKIGDYAKVSAKYQLDIYHTTLSGTMAVKVAGFCKSIATPLMTILI